MNTDDFNSGSQVPGSESGRKSNIKKIVAVILVIAIIVVSMSLWYFLTRPVTLMEVANREFNPGDTIDVAGTITNIEKYNTTYGPLTLLTLDDYENVSEIYKLVADSEKDYGIGDYYQTTLHFEEYEYNGDRIVTAKELYYTYLMPVAIAIMLEQVSFASGFQLVQVSTDGNGMAEYEVFTRNGDKFPLDMFNVSMEKWVGSLKMTYTHKTSLNLFANEYFFLSGGCRGCEKVDSMESLEDYTSENESIEYVDVNHNNLLDDNDVFRVNIPPTLDEYTINSYYLTVGGDWEEPNIAAGVKYLINWHKGFYEWYEIDNIGLSYVSEEKNGTLVDTTLEVSKIEREISLPFDQYNFSLHYDYTGDLPHYEPSKEVVEGIITINESISVEYDDANKNAKLDVEDRFIIRGLKNQTTALLILLDPTSSRVAEIEWIAGYGHIIGRLPEIDFDEGVLISGNPNQYRINATVPYWHPQLLANSTMKLLVSTSSSDIEPADVLVEDGVKKNYGGINVTFFDADKDTYLSTNDYFKIECDPGTTYHFRLFLFQKQVGHTVFDVE
jgi:hypothetical protein